MYILVLGEDSVQELDDTMITAEAKYSINFTRSKRKSLHYSGSKIFIFVNPTKIQLFKAKDSGIRPYPLCLRDISNYLNGYVYDFSVDYNSIDVSDIINIYKYLIKKHGIKQCLD